MLEFTAIRRTNAVELMAKFSDLNGWSASVMATDTPTGLTYSFDTFAIRPADLAQTATNFVFTEFKVETIATAPAAPPMLNIMRAGEDVVLSWPTNAAAGFQLESNAHLSTDTWTSAGPPSVVGDHYVVTSVVSGASQRFYRLHKP
jgi:hypothetical protein